MELPGTQLRLGLRTVHIGFLVFSIYLAFSRYGKIRLGGQDEEPEFSTVSWVAMMFSAGMGIGLMFWGAAEPLSHMAPPRSGSRSPNTPGRPPRWRWSTPLPLGIPPVGDLRRHGAGAGLLHLPQGHAQPVSTRSTRCWATGSTGQGRTIDILAIFATLFGSATSLGLGALQINSG